MVQRAGRRRQQGFGIIGKPVRRGLYVISRGHRYSLHNSSVSDGRGAGAAARDVIKVLIHENVAALRPQSPLCRSDRRTVTGHCHCSLPMPSHSISLNLALYPRIVPRPVAAPWRATSSNLEQSLGRSAQHASARPSAHAPSPTLLSLHHPLSAYIAQRHPNRDVIPFFCGTTGAVGCCP